MMNKRVFLSLIALALLSTTAFLGAQTFGYSRNEPLLKEIVEEDISSGSAIPKSKIVFSYLSQDVERLSRFSRYYYNQEFIEHERTDIEYDDGGRITTSMICRVREGVASEYIETTATYDDLSRLIGMEVYEWESGARIHSDTFEIDYFEDAIVLTQYFITEGEIDSSRQVLYIFSQGKLDYELSQRAVSSEDYIYTGETRFSYHAQDSSTKEDFERALSSQLPIKFSLLPFEYPALISEIYTRVHFDNDWLPRIKTIYSYNDALQKTAEQELRYHSYGWNNYRSNQYYYDNHDVLHHVISNDYSSATELVIRYNYHYYDYVSNSDISAPALIDFSCHPSPFKDGLKIQFGSDYRDDLTAGVYNLKGQRVNSLAYHGSGEMTWNGKDRQGRDLPTGVYLIKIETKTQSAIKKVIKLK